MILLPTTAWTTPVFRLKAEPVNARILPEGEALTPMLGFNGSSPGPELRVRQGDWLTVAFENGSGRRARSSITHSTSLTRAPTGTTPITGPGNRWQEDFTVP